MGDKAERRYIERINVLLKAAKSASDLHKPTPGFDPLRGIAAASRR